MQNHVLRDELAHHMRRERRSARRLRVLAGSRLQTAGMVDAGRAGMRSDETWTIPLHIIMWTTIVVGLIMALAVVMMH